MDEKKTEGIDLNESASRQLVLWTDHTSKHPTTRSNSVGLVLSSPGMPDTTSLVLTSSGTPTKSSLDRGFTSHYSESLSEFVDFHLPLPLLEPKKKLHRRLDSIEVTGLTYVGKSG